MADSKPAQKTDKTPDKTPERKTDEMRNTDAMRSPDTPPEKSRRLDKPSDAERLQKPGRANVTDQGEGQYLGGPAPVTFPEPVPGPREATTPASTDPDLERRDRRADEQPGAEDLEGTPLDPQGVKPRDPKRFSARLVDNAYVELYVDGDRYELTQDELGNLAGVLATASVELVR